MICNDIVHCITRPPTQPTHFCPRCRFGTSSCSYSIDYHLIQQSTYKEFGLFNPSKALSSDSQKASFWLVAETSFLLTLRPKSNHNISTMFSSTRLLSLFLAATLPLLAHCHLYLHALGPVFETPHRTSPLFNRRVICPLHYPGGFTILCKPHHYRGTHSSHARFYINREYVYTAKYAPFFISGYHAVYGERHYPRKWTDYPHGFGNRIVCHIRKKNRTVRKYAVTVSFRCPGVVVGPPGKPESASPSVSVSASPSISVSVSVAPSVSVSPSNSVSTTPSTSAVPSQTPSKSPSASPSSTPSASVSSSAIPSVTATSSAAASVSVTAVASPSPSALKKGCLNLRAAHIGESKLDEFPTVKIEDGKSYCPRKLLGSWSFTIECEGSASTNSVTFTIDELPDFTRTDKKKPFLITATKKKFRQVRRFQAFTPNEFFTVTCRTNDGHTVVNRFKIFCKNSKHLWWGLWYGEAHVVASACLCIIS